MKSGNVRKLVVIYWQHSSLDWANAYTRDLHYELWYNDALRVPARDDLKFVWANCNRHTESYQANRDTVEYYRRHKIRREILVYIELWEPNEEGRREEYWSIDSEYRFKQLLKRLDWHLNHYQEIEKLKKETTLSPEDDRKKRSILNFFRQ